MLIPFGLYLRSDQGVIMSHATCWKHGTLAFAALCLLSAGAIASDEKAGEADDEATKSDVASHELSHVVQQSAQPARTSQPVQSAPTNPAQPSRTTRSAPGTPARTARPASPTPAATSRARMSTAPATPATRGNPDRPVITGRAPNPADAAGDRPTESLSLNFDKIRATSVRVRSTHRQQSRVIVRGWDNRFYALPDGTYTDGAGQQLVVSLGNVEAGSSGDMVMKGKKILQNAFPDGKFGGPGGAWIEVSGGKIVSVGGQLERHTPPPYLDVNGDGSIAVRDE